MTDQRPLIVTPRGIVGSLLVLLVAAACVRLGLWQLDRLGQRRDRNDVVEARFTATPMELNGVSGDSAGIVYRRVRLTGTYDHDHDVVLAGRSLHGLPGVHLFSPLRLERGGAVLVERGWLPSADARSVDTAPYRRQGTIVVEGIALPFPTPERTVPVADTFSGTWYRLGAPGPGVFPYRTAPFYVRRLVAADGGEPPALLAPPELGDGPHLSYAVQWFSFATIAVVGWIVLLLRSDGRGRAGEDDRPTT